MGLFGDLPPPAAQPKHSKAEPADKDIDAELLRLARAEEEEDPLVAFQLQQAAAEQQQKSQDLRRRSSARRHLSEDEDEEGDAELEPLADEGPRRAPGRHSGRHAEDTDPPAAKQPRLDHAPEPHLAHGSPVPPAESSMHGQAHVHAEGPAPTAQPVQSEDQVTAALRKITAHISNAAKFPKASPLLRQLLDGPSLTTAHRPDLFQAVRAAFKDPSRCTEPTLRREYMKLVSAVASRPDLFGKPEKAHLDVYRIIGYIQNEMSTDDSFVFNKAVARIKELVEELPEEVDAADEEAMARLQQHPEGAWSAPGSAHAEEAERRRQQEQQMLEKWQRQRRAELERQKQEELEEQARQQQQQQQAQEDGEVELDPFGLDSLLAAEAPKPAAAAAASKRKREAVPAEPPKLPPAPPATTAWNGPEVACMRREALLEALHTARGHHKNTWARTSIELLIEHCHERGARFCASQQAELEELMVWVRHQRALRKQGPSVKEINRDSTSFERARAEWSKATVSHRGKVGGGGDAKANNWLG